VEHLFAVLYTGDLGSHQCQPVFNADLIGGQQGVFGFGEFDAWFHLSVWILGHAFEDQLAEDSEDQREFHVWAEPIEGEADELGAVFEVLANGPAACGGEGAGLMGGFDGVELGGEFINGTKGLGLPLTFVGKWHRHPFGDEIFGICCQW